MNYVVAMSIAERGTNLRDNPEPVCHGEWRIGVNEFFKGLAFDALHDDVRKTVVITEVIHGDDIGVLEPAGATRLIVETGEHSGIALKILGESLDGDIPAHLFVIGAIRPHPCRRARAPR